jgi:hypothetical protein
MKNQIKNLLRAGVFMLAAVFAFAFAQPVPQGLTQYGNNNGTYVPLTGLAEGTHYLCDDEDPIACIVTFSNNNPQTGQMVVVKEGIWTDLR